MDNKANRAGAIYASSEADVQIDSCLFDMNFAATIGSAIVAFEIQAANFTIKNSNFTKNSAEQALISVEQTLMVIKGCRFYDNAAELLTGGVILSGAKLTFINSTVDSSYQFEDIPEFRFLAGFFYLSSKSELDIRDDSYLINQMAVQAAAILCMAESRVALNYTTIVNSRTPHTLDASGVLFARQCKSTTVTNCVFSHNNDHNIYVENSNLFVANTSFLDLESKDRAFITGKRSSAQILNSTLQRASSYNSEGSGIQFRASESVHSEGNMFTQLNGTQGGAVYIKTTNEATILHNTF